MGRISFVGDALRSTEVAVGIHSNSFCTRVAAAIAREPAILAPRPWLRSRRAVAPIPRSRARRCGFSGRDQLRGGPAAASLQHPAPVQQRPFSPLPAAVARQSPQTNRRAPARRGHGRQRARAAGVSGRASRTDDRRGTAARDSLSAHRRATSPKVVDAAELVLVDPRAATVSSLACHAGPRRRRSHVFADCRGGTRPDAAHRRCARRCNGSQAIQQAAVRVNYSGTVVYQAGGEMRTSRITHMFDGATFARTRTDARWQAARVHPPSHRQQRRSPLPDPGVAPRRRSSTVRSRIRFRADRRAGRGNARSAMTLKIGRLERVAGVECQVLTLEPRDALRYGYRLCVDRRDRPVAEVRRRSDEQRDVLEQVAFTDIRIGEQIDRPRLKPAWPTEGWTVERSEYPRVDWSMRAGLFQRPRDFGAPRKSLRRWAQRMRCRLCSVTA